MKKSYESPIVTNNMELAEGVYMASGEGSSNCFTADAYIHQWPETGRQTYVMQVNGKHNADHHSGSGKDEGQTLVITFNIPVTYVHSQGKLQSGDGTTELRIAYFYHQNEHDNIGLGDLEVKAADGLAITKVKIIDNACYCKQHNK